MNAIGERVEAWTKGLMDVVVCNPAESCSRQIPGADLANAAESFTGGLGTLTSIGPVGHVFVIAHSLRAPDSRAFESLLDEALRRAPAPPHPVAVARARAVLAAAQAIRVPDRVAVARSGNVAISFFRERRFGIFECDEDGDTVLTLTDRDDDHEADTYVVEPGQERLYVARTARFVNG